MSLEKAEKNGRNIVREKRMAWNIKAKNIKVKNKGTSTQLTTYSTKTKTTRTASIDKLVTVRSTVLASGVNEKVEGHSHGNGHVAIRIHGYSSV